MSLFNTFARLWQNNWPLLLVLANILMTISSAREIFPQDEEIYAESMRARSHKYPTSDELMYDDHPARGNKLASARWFRDVDLEMSELSDGITKLQNVFHNDSLNGLREMKVKVLITCLKVSLRHLLKGKKVKFSEECCNLKFFKIFKQCNDIKWGDTTTTTTTTTTTSPKPNESATTNTPSKLDTTTTTTSLPSDSTTPKALGEKATKDEDDDGKKKKKKDKKRRGRTTTTTSKPGKES